MEHVQYPGLLQPNPIPNRPWNDIAMDFIDGLSNSDHKNSILVVVDRFSKHGHFIPLLHPYTTKDIATVSFYHIHKLPGLTNKWQRHNLCKPVLVTPIQELGITLAHCSVYHPQTDGQTEKLNQCLENFLRCMTCDRPKQWAKWLPLAEWWYNTTYHIVLQMTPFEALYGYPPPHLTIPQVKATPDKDGRSFCKKKNWLYRSSKQDCILDERLRLQGTFKAFKVIRSYTSSFNRGNSIERRKGVNLLRQ